MTPTTPRVDGPAVHQQLDADGVLTLTLDLPGRAQNVLNASLMAALADAVERLAGDADVKGAILVSGKPDFLAGGDIDELFAITTAQAAFDAARQLQQLTRRLETTGKPVVAAVRGSALGGGLELVLACHHRIVAPQPRARYGLPEVTLGLLPGGGGTQRLPRLIGLKDALPLLLEGTPCSAERALALGIFQARADDGDDLLGQARAWIAAHPSVQQPWDVKGFKFPGGHAQHPANVPMVVAAPGLLRNKTRGHFPAPLNILGAAVQGSLVDIHNGLKIEARFFAELVVHPVTKNILTSTWYQLNALNKGGARPAGLAPRTVRRLGVLGAGMMGAGIAHAAAQAGIPVVLKDLSLQAAEQGKALAERLTAAAVAKGRSTEAQRAALLALIQPTGSAADLAGCDLVVEAVFEDRALKSRVIQEAEGQMAADGVFATNTSTLPISGLAEASRRPAQFIGIHFFSPVDKMPLVEIIVGRQTSADTLARAFDLVRQLKKTPIVVNDARGFYTTRVFSTYVQEGLVLLGEGQAAALIENLGVAAGMPVGPLALCDELSLGLMLHVTAQTRADFEAEGRAWPVQPHEAVVQRLAHHCQRSGRKAGQGFYDYPAQGRKRLWPGLAEQFPAQAALAPCDITDRLMFVQALETVRCMDEGVVERVADANIGSLFGWGFAPHLGGTLQAINSHGLPAFVARAQQLASRFGPRFLPPQRLLDMAAAGRRF
jgi:3-hydroxyacyl-CoA dehydrogenase/enoyl-CoA hydratase/3-hydroxybutyryl-CoA epimerase